MKKITLSEFMNATIEQISQVYSGKRNHCRCGCGGNYISTTYAKYELSEINESLVLKRLNRAKKLIEKGADVDFGSTWVDVETGDNRTLTFYFDDIK